MSKLIITKFPEPNEGAFTLDHNTDLKDVKEGQYLIRQQFDSENEESSTQRALEEVFNQIVSQYPNSTHTFDIPGRPPGMPMVVNTPDGKFELRMKVQVK